MEAEKNIHNIFSNLKKGSEIKECFYHKTEECTKNDIKNAHSVSRPRLELIKGLVNKNEKVYSVSELIIENGIAKKCIKDIGWAKAASTFYGFCGLHDTKLFLPIENNNDFNESTEHCFLHSYRSFAYSFHELKKTYKLANNVIGDISKQINELPITDLSDKLTGLKNQLHNLETENTLFPKEELQKQSVTNLLPKIENLNKLLETTLGKNAIDLSQLNLDKINTFNDVSGLFDKLPVAFNQLKSMLSDSKEKLSYTKEELDSKHLHSWSEWMKKYKVILDNAIESKSYGKLKYRFVVKEGLFPFACAFAFSPDFLYSGINNIIFPSTNPEDVLNSCLMATVLPDKSNKTIIIFACFDGDRQSEYFLNKLFSLKNEEEFERAVTSIIINKSSNVFLNPTMWDKLGERQKILEKEINLKRSFDELPEKPFMSEINFFSSEFLATELGIN